MGSVTQPLTLFASDGTRSESVDALVDTGSTYTVIPADVLARLGVVATGTKEFELGDSRVVAYPVCELPVRLDGQMHTALVVFGPADSTPLLGVVTLEIFSLGVDPVGKRLVPVRNRL